MILMRVRVSIHMEFILQADEDWIRVHLTSGGGQTSIGIMPYSNVRRFIELYMIVV